MNGKGAARANDSLDMEDFSEFFREKTLVVTGGTGSFGKALLTRALTLPFKRIVVFSRDEYKQYRLAARFTDSRVDWRLGDVRDIATLTRVFRGTDMVVHAAALKHVPLGEKNAFEFIHTNVLGTQNVIDAAENVGVKRALLLSTTKAAAPAGLYGASKLSAEKLFLDANRVSHQTVYSAVRFGNLFGAGGSIVPHFVRLKSSGVLPVTQPEMTRFSLTLTESAEWALRALAFSIGGETLAPIAPTYRVADVAMAIGPDCRHEVIGLRTSEKLHEDMITVVEAGRTLSFDGFYIILPPYIDIEAYKKQKGGTFVPPDFSYHSAIGKPALSVAELAVLVEEFIQKWSSYD